MASNAAVLCSDFIVAGGNDMRHGRSLDKKYTTQSGVFVCVVSVHVCLWAVGTRESVLVCACMCGYVTVCMCLCMGCGLYVLGAVMVTQCDH